MVSVLFVCLGNICRSPTAEGVFRRLCQREGVDGRVIIDSAGTAAFHVGEPPDLRAQAAATRRGVHLGGLQARQVRGEDFTRFDYILAMDRANLADLVMACPEKQHDRLHLFLGFADDVSEREVPDPYYGGDDGFDTVLDLCEAASAGLLADIRRRFPIT